MSEVVTFGEIMLRLAPEGYYRFFQNDRMQATFGGSEANVAASLANFGVETAFVTKLPDNPIGKGAVSTLRGFGVNTDNIVFGGERMGIYFLEKGAAQRGSLCVYDRAHSAISEAKSKDFDWDKIFANAGWFHFSGITPALSENLAHICEEACIAAKKRNIPISVDLNYRSKLWSKEQANLVMSRLCGYADVCIANEDDAKNVFGIETSTCGDKLNREEYISTAKQLRDKFGFGTVAITLRRSYSACDNDWSALILKDNECCFSKEYAVHIVDRVGAGDSFCAGLIFSLIKEKSAQETIEFAAAASALKHSVEGDFNRVSVSEVEKLACGDGFGRIVR